MRVDKTVREAMERIRLKACEGLMAQDVVKLFDCSRRMAEIRFRNGTGMSIVEAIRETRLEKAKELLTHPRRPPLLHSPLALADGISYNSRHGT